jgi:hypothetical protein
MFREAEDLTGLRDPVARELLVDDEYGMPLFEVKDP